MNKIILSLTIHNHQPVGNFGWVFEEAYEKAYLPMLECLERHPTIRMALHYTGPLRDWLVENIPDFFPRLGKLVKRGQVEIMSGAYYEPILVVLNDADKIGQIRKQTESVKEDFDFDASGLWLAERVWEPHLPRILNEAGIEYTIVDDTHFKAIGYTDDDLLGYYVTEEQGKTLKVFATSMPLRYSIPWKDVDHVINWLREQAESNGYDARYMGKQKIATMGDDGEKFGMWPGTYDYVWTGGWMDRFFEAIEANSDWLETMPPGEVAKNYPSLGRIYLPTSSYEEMGEWAMPPFPAWELPHLKHMLADEGRTDILKYMRGGLWRQFQVKYAEVNQLHKKSLLVSEKVQAMTDGPRKQQALDALWAGQCNCGYWHGVFGGIYLFHIRQIDYENLIKAENLADGLDRADAKPFARSEIVDFDRDGLDDAILTGDKQTLIFDLDQGGSVVEWDFRPTGYNLANVLTRQREGYHKTLEDAALSNTIVVIGEESGGDEPDNIHSEVVRVREPGLQHKLIYDWHRRASFIDHFLDADTTLDGFYRSQYGESGDFVNQPYAASLSENDEGIAIITLTRGGAVWQGGMQLPVTVEKIVSLAPGESTLTVDYTVTNGDGGTLEKRFGVETNWGLAGGNDDHTYLSVGFGRYSLGEISSNDEVDDLTITSNLWGIKAALEVDRPVTLWRFPLETISASEAGFELNYQGSTFLLWWPIKLKPGESWKVTIKTNIQQL